MTVVTGDILKTVLNYSYPGAGTALNIFYWVYAGSTRPDSEVTTAIKNWAIGGWGNNWEDIASQDATIDSVDIQKVDGTGLVLADLGNEIVNLVGAQVGSVTSAAVSAWLGASTATPQIRGSKFVPGIAEASVQDGLLNAGALTNLGLLLLEYLGNMDVGGGDVLTPGIISKRALAFVPFSNTGQITDVPAYQRRRKPGVGI